MSFPNMLTLGQDLHFDQIMTEDVKSMSGGTQRSASKRITGRDGKDAALLIPCLRWERTRGLMSSFHSVSNWTQIEGHLKAESNGVEGLPLFSVCD